MRYQGYEIKSKPTVYGDTVFRSVLEARWAVFMDLLAVRYEYEPYCSVVGTDLYEVAYKPDFVLTDLIFTIEIKPRKPNRLELIKMYSWAACVGDVIVFFDFNQPNGKTTSGWRVSYDDDVRCGCYDEMYWWCECPRCCKIDICECGQIDCGCFSNDEFNEMYLEGTKYEYKFEHSPNILTAFKLAKKYNFPSKKRVKPLSRIRLLV
jgi:hypothetical protein